MNLSVSDEAYLPMRVGEREEKKLGQRERIAGEMQ
jgi:hypothetical protein